MNSRQAAIRIEFGDTATFACPCCGRNSETVHGFVYDDHGGTVVYFAGYTVGHDKRHINFVLSTGAWGEGATPDARECIAIKIHLGEESTVYEFPPIETSPWYGEAFLGKMMHRDELSTDERMHYQILVSVLIEQDPRLAAYLAHG